MSVSDERRQVLEPSTRQLVQRPRTVTSLQAGRFRRGVRPASRRREESESLDGAV